MASTPRIQNNLHLRYAGDNVRVKHYGGDKQDLVIVSFGSFPHSEVELFLSIAQFESLRESVNNPETDNA
jgi:hypothetical protein